ncbi:MAG: sigma-70 family RNA polymerase sigma factor [Firmicutes bacterium]|nr:sigma-70 family RNA polymerase sigma factor [Bacillota bacterium]
MDLKGFTPHVRREMAKIYAMYSVAIKYKALSILKDEALAEDCMHDVMLKIAANLDCLGEYGSQRAKGFIMTITQNHAIDIYRRRKREEASGLIPSGDPFGSDHVHDNDVVIGKFGYDATLDTYMENLDDIDRAIVGMKYGYKMKHKEIAKVLGKTVSAIDKRSERIKTKVKAFVMENRFNEDE